MASALSSVCCSLSGGGECLKQDTAETHGMIPYDATSEKRASLTTTTRIRPYSTCLDGNCEDYVLCHVKTVMESLAYDIIQMPIYLDYNATTPLEPSVVESITKSLTENWANPSSGYASGIAAKKIINDARKYISLMIGANQDDIIFTSGGTEANNMVIFGILDYYSNWLKVNSIKHESNDKPHVITTNVEHDAVILPIKHLQKKGAIEATVVPVSETGCINVQDILSEVRPTTCLISVMLANNETGVVMPVEQIGSSIRHLNKQRKANKLIEILYHTDAAQAFGKIEVDAGTLQVDYITIVGHKFYGPRIGCLYVRGLGEKIPLYPLLHGGGQESGYRPGTENTPMIAGLGEAARLVLENLTQYSNHMAKIRNYLEKKLKETFGNEVVFNCKSGVTRLSNTCNMSFTKKGLYGHRVLSRCTNISASIGAACHASNQPSGILIASGVPTQLAKNAIRLSVGRETTETDIDTAVNDLKKAVEMCIELDL